MSERFPDAIAALPLVAVLRGVVPERAAAVSCALVTGGFTALEVTLNSDRALESISIMKAAVPAHVAVGAGTVLSVAEAGNAVEAGAEFLVMPNLNEAVMRAGRNAKVGLMPGVFTPSEAFSALEMGASVLKLFPADAFGVAGLRALRAVLPKARGLIYPTSGIDVDTMAGWVDAGADGFGIGGSVFKPSFSDDEIEVRARTLVSKCRQLMGIGS